MPPAKATLETESLRRSALAISIGVAAMITLMIIVGVREVWPILQAGFRPQVTFLLFGLMGVAAVTSIFANRRVYSQRAVLGMLLAIIACGTLTSAFMLGLGLILGVMIFLLAVALAALALPSRLTNRVILLGTLGAAAAYILDLGAYWARSPATTVIITGLAWILGVAALVAALLLIRVYIQLPLLSKLVLPFMIVSVLSVSLLTSYDAAATRTALTASADQRLRAAALLTAAQIDAFYISEVNAMLVERSLTDLLAYVELPADVRVGSVEEDAANKLIRILQTRGFQTRGFIQSYTMLDLEGNVLLDTRVLTPALARALPRTLELDLSEPDFLEQTIAQDAAHVTSVIYDDINQPVFYFAVPMIGAAGSPVGFLVSGYSLPMIQRKIIASNNGLAGEGSFASILSADGLRLGNGLDPLSLNTLIVPKSSDQLTALVGNRRLPRLPIGSLVVEYPMYAGALKAAIDMDMQPGTSDDENTTHYFTALEAGSVGTNRAAMVRAANLPWYVSYLQPQAILLAPITRQTRLTTLFGLAVAAVLVLASILIAQLLTRPIQRLTETAENIAGGNLASRVVVRSRDEIGSLGTVFNAMASELQQILTGLEKRVDERTSELAVTTAEAHQRAEQLQAISEIARAVASERELDKLLPLITHTISDRFGVYHVGIFLVDDRQEFAILRAANSEGGQRMLARTHRLRVGQEGIIGYVTSRGEPRVALDVGSDAVFFDNPDLPATRSEIGLPLRAAGKVIGALDVQSTQPNAFGAADVSLLTTLADQVSIAIENARLFSDTTQALRDLEAIQRQYLRQQWQRNVTDSSRAGYIYDFGQVRPQETAAAPHAAGEGAGQSAALTSPITLRGEEIGAIELGDPAGDRNWTEEERSLVQAVSEQVGLALENARLIEETQRRAEREALVSQITARMRASNDPQAILQTAARELRDALQASRTQILAPNPSAKEEE